MNSNSTCPLYLAYIDINQLYALFDKHNIEYGTWTIERTQPILLDYKRNDDQHNSLSYTYYTQYISYTSMIKIFNDIYIHYIKSSNLHINKIYNVIRSLSATFPDIYYHIDFKLNI